MRHYRIVLQIMHVTELLLLTHKCHKLEGMRHCCTELVLLLAIPPRKAAHLWLSEEILLPHVVHSHLPGFDILSSE